MNPKQMMDPKEIKKTIREQAHANRKAQPDKDALSEVICQKFSGQAEFAAARCVMAYIDVRTEVRTRHYLPKLLEHARPDAPLVALAFECQIFPEIPTQPHDIFMDKIITERTIYLGKGRSGP